MTREDAERLLESAREVRWAFPTSFGRPSPAGRAVDRLVAERERLAQAAEALDEDEAVELAACSWRAFVLAGDFAGGRAFLGPLLGRATKPSPALAVALYGDGLLALRQGAVQESRERNEAALEAASAVGDPEALLLANLGLGRVAFETGDYQRALALAQQARKHARGLDPALGQAPLGAEAQARRMLGDLDAAAELFRESLALNRRIDDAGMVVVELHNLGHVEIRRGNVDAAERLFAEIGPSDDTYGALNGAALAVGRGDVDRARELLARVEPAEDDLPPDDRAELDWVRDRLSR